MKTHNSFFKSHQKKLGVAATIYVVLLLLSHWQFPPAYVWAIAAVFSIAMNFTYLSEAVYARSFVTAEAVVASILIGASLIGLVFSPLLLIAAIFGHGCWDLAKHFGRGIPFYFWYTCSCFVVDTIYSIALLVYWFSIS